MDVSSCFEKGFGGRLAEKLYDDAHASPNKMHQKSWGYLL